MILYQQPQTVEVKHIVYKWGMQGGFSFDQSPSGFFNKSEFYGTFALGPSMILVVIDPITAVGLNLVTPLELRMPEGATALFNLLNNGHAS